MDEESQDNVSEQVVTDEAESHVEQETQKEKPSESVQARNFAELRRQKDELERTLSYQQQLINEMKAAKQAPAPVVDELESISDEEYIPKGKVKAIAMKEAQRIAKEELERAMQAQHRASFKDRLKSKYSDFDDVVNNETLALLQEKDPELADTIGEIQDPYKMGMQAYKYIKALGVVEAIPQSRRVKEVDKKIEENKKHVQSPQAFDKRPMAQAFRMTREEKNKLYEEMMQYGSRASSVPELQ